MSEDFLIHTADGLIPRSELSISDHVEETSDYRKIQTYYRHIGSGKVVRVDCTISIYRGQTAAPGQGDLNG